MHSVKRKLLVCGMFAALLLSQALPASEYSEVAGTDAGADSDISTGIYAKDAPKHTVAGSTKLKAQVYGGADIHFDSNVLERRNDEQSTFVFAGIVGGRLQFESERLTASLLAQLNGKAYSGFANLDGVTGNADAQVAYNISDSTAVSLRDMFDYVQDPTDIAQDNRAERYFNNLTGIFDAKFAKGALRAGVINTVLDYNGDRYRRFDYIGLEGFAEGSFDVPLANERLNLFDTRAFLRVAAVQYNHQVRGLNDPFFLEVIAGLRGRWQTRFTWDVGFGIDSITVDEKPDAPNDTDKEVAFAFQAQLNYQFDDRTLFTIEGSRRAEVSEVCNFQMVTRVSGTANHYFTERWNAELQVGYQYAQRSIQNANLFRTSAMLRTGYSFKATESLPLLRVWADYTFVSRDGDQTSFEYTDHQIGGGIGTNF